MRIYTSALALAAALSAMPLAAQETLEEIAARYGARASILDASLSPSGNKLAIITPDSTHGERVEVIDLTVGGDLKTVLFNTERNGDITNCDWATEARLVCSLDAVIRARGGTLLWFSRLLSVGDDGSELKVLTERQSNRSLDFRQDGGSIVALDVEGEDDRILMTKAYVPERSIGTRLANERRGLGVDLVDVVKASGKTVERPDNDATSYIADDKGNIRLKVSDLREGDGSLIGERIYFYREPGSSRWKKFDAITYRGSAMTDFRPVAIDSARNVAYGFDSLGGFEALFEVPLDTSGEAKLVMSRDDVDVDRLIRIGRQRRVVGASYATEKRTIEYFDTELASLAKNLGAALPGNPKIAIWGASADENELLVAASSDVDPGMIYRFSKDTQQLEPLLPLRDFLVERPMGTMQPITFPAADGTQIPGYLTLPPGAEGKGLPAIVLPHGGPSARDEWGFDWLVQFFAARGYAVLQPNYRGSSGYGEAWFGKNGFQAWETAVGDVNDAGRWLVEQGIAKPEALAVAGWSYGGYAALQSQVLDPNLYKAVVAIAPVTDLDNLRDDARAYTNFKYVDEFIGDGPHVAAGSPARHADRFAAPVLLFHGSQDLNVEIGHSRKMEDRLKGADKPVKLVEFEGLAHSLRDSQARREMLVEIDTFLAETLAE